jgi:Trk K+ transport system NAD-binding subunit
MLDEALEALLSSPGHWVPVVDGERRVLGTLGLSDLVRAYRTGLLDDLNGLGGAAGPETGRVLDVEAGAPLDGVDLRHAGLPPGVVILSIQRKGGTVVPAGDTVLHAGDRLVALGHAGDLERMAAAVD